MTGKWQRIELGQVLTPAKELISINPTERYRQVTVKYWGKGVVLRGCVLGSEIAADYQCVVRTAQFIISKIDARFGACGLVPADLDGSIVSSDFPVFSINQSDIHPKFLDWMSKTKWFVESCKRASEGSTNRVRLTEERFLNLRERVA